MSLLLKISDLVEGVVVKRPSKLIKTPYVADTLISGTNEEIIAHTASLGCCGLADAGANILMTKMPIPKNKNTKQKCAYRIYLSIYQDTIRGKTEIIGIHPKLAEDLAESALNQNLLSNLQNVQRYRRETKIFVQDKVDSRFDFSGIDESGIPFLMEIKNVPLADFEDVTAKDRKKIDFSNRDFASKVAYFPDGYRKKSADPISPRALKHIRELTLIKKESRTRCILCFVIQRTDVDRFTPSIIDPEYREAFQDAIQNGVEIITMVVKWTQSGEAIFVKDNLPIVL